MAGDWIKMRDKLFTHPKFIGLSNLLIYGDNHGMLIYTCGSDALEIGVMPSSNEDVTNCALRCVTHEALRDVAMCALLRVWCSVNEHCKVINDHDVAIAGLRPSDLDVIAGFDGFGEALAIVEWVEECDNSLVFKGFLEHNEPACLRPKPKSNAQRQKKYRDKKRQEVGVTKVTKSNDTEEKRREEKSKYINKKEPANLPEGTVLCGQWDTDAVAEALAKWVVHLRHNGKNPSAGTIEQICMNFDRCGKSIADGIEAINYSLRQSLANIHFPPPSDGTFNNGKGKSLSELLDEKEAALL